MPGGFTAPLAIGYCKGPIFCIFAV